MMLGERMSGRPRLAVFSPLTPQRSGIADYMEDLLPALTERAEVHLFADDWVAPANPALRWQAPVYRSSLFEAADALYRYDLAIYQMGNSPVHRQTYPLVFQRPGILVLHDLVLHHLIAGMTFAQGDLAGYVREMAFAYGEEGQALAEQITAGRLPPPFFSHPLSERAMRASLAVIVHSEFGVRLVQHCAPGVPVVRVPMGIPYVEEPDRAAARAALGLPQDSFVVASLGEASPHKRIEEALEGFADVARNHSKALYVIVGNVAPGMDFLGLAERLGIRDQVLVTGHVSREAFQNYLAAMDVCMNLRYPTAGETSATALRAMALGKPVLVSDIGANQEFPDAVCGKLPVFDGEQEAIAAALRRLVEEPDWREQMGRAAREFVLTEHTLEAAAAGYMGIVEQLLHTGLAIATQGDILRSVAASAAEVGLRPGDGPLLAKLVGALHDVGVRAND